MSAGPIGPDGDTARRKGEHLRIALEEEVQHGGGTLLEEVQLVHQALPELDLEEIDTRTPFFGKELRAPLMITSMTGGGGGRTREMNLELARVAGRSGIAFAVGSQRAMLERPEARADFEVRTVNPDGVLLGNIGAVQLPQYSVEAIAGLVEAIGGDGLCVHLNPAQELVQPEGDRSFRGLLDGIARLVDRLGGRVLVKETGAGLSPETLERLRAIGVTAVDVAGSGGTSFTRVEMHRSPPGIQRGMAETLADWGVPTALSVIAARRCLGASACVVASGGIRSGLDGARAIAAGATVVGCARRVLQAWHEGGEAGAETFVSRTMEEIRAILLLTGCQSPVALQRAPRIYTGVLRHWLEAYGWHQRPASSPAEPRSGQ